MMPPGWSGRDSIPFKASWRDCIASGLDAPFLLSSRDSAESAWYIWLDNPATAAAIFPFRASAASSPAWEYISFRDICFKSSNCSRKGSRLFPSTLSISPMRSRASSTWARTGGRSGSCCTTY